MSTQGSRVIIALDPPDNVDVARWCLEIIGSTRPLVAGYKIGLPLMARIESTRVLKEIAEAMGGSVLKIVDLKLADIGDIMVSTVKPFIDMGFNVFIAHAFIGLEDGLDKLSRFLHGKGARLVAVVSMSHKGASRTMDKMLRELVEIAVEAGSWGVVAPATRPRVVREVRRILEELSSRARILSPGIGAQGAPPGSALEAGADYEIVGRLVTRSSDPRGVVEEINSIHKRVLSKHD